MFIELNNRDLKNIRYDFWAGAFYEGRATGLLKDGIYYPKVDRDFVKMYCSI